MLNFVQKHFTAIFATACLASLPTFAYADICEQINFSAQDMIYDQIVKKVPANDTLTAKDAACIISNVKGSHRQEKVGRYLAVHLENPDNLDILLNAVKDRDVRNIIEREALDSLKNNHNRPNHNNNSDSYHNGQNSSSSKVISNVCGRIQYKRYKKNETPYKQLTAILTGNSYITANDAACVLRNTDSSQQREIGMYMAARLNDPENINLLLREVKSDKVKSAIESSVRSPAYNNSGNNNHEYNGSSHNNPSYHGNTYSKRTILSGIASKIDYGRGDNVPSQLQLYLGDNLIYANEAAAIVGKVWETVPKKNTAKYLIARLADPENANQILKKFTFSDEINEVLLEGIKDINNNPNDSRYKSQKINNLYNRIDFSRPSGTLLNQVKYFAANNLVYASDAAKVVKKVNDASVQSEVGIYLVSRLADPENVNLVIQGANFSSAKDRITQAAVDSQRQDLNHQNRPNRNPYSQRQIISNLNTKVDFSNLNSIVQQLQLYLGDNLVYAKDAARIIDKSALTRTQIDAASYLITRLADPENANLMLKPISFTSEINSVLLKGIEDIDKNSNDPRYKTVIMNNLYGKLNFSASEATILNQVKYFAALNWVYAKDAAQIVKKVFNSGTQGEVGAFLVTRLADPENVNLVIQAADFDSTKNIITQAALANQKNTASQQQNHSNRNHYGSYNHAKIVEGVYSKIDFSFSDKVYTQVQLYVGDNLIYAKEAGKIVSRISYSNVQETVGTYLIDRLADPENVDLVIKSASFQSSRDVLTKAALSASRR